MKIVRGLGIFLCVLVIAFIVLFNINNVMYRTSNEHINIFGYKLMTIDNKYDYYLVKDVSINDVILYDNVSFRVNSTDLSTDSVKGRVNDCLKLAKSSTVVCSDNLEGKVIMKVNGARDFLFANKGSIIALIACIILLILVFLWKPEKKKQEVPASKPKEEEKPVVPAKEQSVTPVQAPAPVAETPPVAPVASAAPVVPTQPNPVQPAAVAVTEAPVREEIKKDVELPVETEVNNDTVTEVDKFNVNNNLDNQSFVTPPVTIGGQPVVDIPLDVDQFEVKNDTPAVENVDVNKFEIQEENKEPDVAVAPYTAPSNEEFEQAIREPSSENKEVDDSLNDVIVVPYDKVMEMRQKKAEENVQTEEEQSTKDEEVVKVPVSYSSDRYDEFNEVIKVPIQKHREYYNAITVPYNKYEEYNSAIRVPFEKYEEFNKITNNEKIEQSIFDTPIEHDIFSDANINTSVEIDLDDVEVEEHSNKIKVTPIYSRSIEFDDDVEIL